jgi:Cns1/TTC4 Wheel domain
MLLLYLHFCCKGGEDGSEMTWPVLLLYPYSNQSDLVAAMGEHDVLADHLATVFPEEGPPAQWDRAFQYKCSTVEVYARTRAVRAFADEHECVEAFKVSIFFYTCIERLTTYTHCSLPLCGYKSGSLVCA